MDAETRVKYNYVDSLAKVAVAADKMMMFIDLFAMESGMQPSPSVVELRKALDEWRKAHAELQAFDPKNPDKGFHA